MTALSLRPIPKLQAGGSRRGVVFAAVLAGCALTTALFWPQLRDVWRHGAFFDSDDAMQMVQVRALLAGQHWFDLTAYRLDPPAGVPMHWSRTVDLPIAALVSLFGAVCDAATAEALTRLILPLVYLASLLCAVAWLAGTLFGRIARVPAIAAVALNGAATIQFEPGRIDHHAPQIVILALMAATAVLALDTRQAPWAAAIGALVGVSLSISLENLPFVAALIAMLVAVWVWQGAGMDRLLRFLALGLAGGLAPPFLATVAPERWLAPVCDAYGAAHLGAGLIAAAGCALLAVASVRLRSRASRLAGAAAVAVAVLAFLRFAYPACLHDPFAGVDPLVREVWISKVQESQPLAAVFRATPMAALLYTLPVAMGLAGCLGAALAARGTAALRIALVAGLIAAGLAMMFWQIRVVTSVTPLAVCGALPLALGLHRRFARLRRPLAAGLAFALVVPFTGMAWLLMLPDDGVPAHGNSGCFAPASLAALRKLAPGSVVAPVDAGSFLLAQTDLGVFAGPYHRDNDGNRFAMESFLAEPQAAYRLLLERHATYLMTCPGLDETTRLAARAPDGLAAALLAGRPPAWLEPIAVAATPYAVFRILPAGAERRVSAGPFPSVP